MRSVAAALAALTTLVLAPSAVARSSTEHRGAVQPCMEPTYPTAEPDWGSRLTSARTTTVTKHDVQIESADGTLIAARVYLPDAFKRRKPAILIMSPYQAVFGQYTEEMEDLQLIEAADCMAPFLLQRGYAVVLGDMRGTHNSDGCFDYGGRGDQEDGYAVVQWIARRPWSTGKVGMYGVSHVGMSQYSAAVASPPALKAIIPIAPITSFYRYLYYGGVHYETNMLTPPAYDYAVAGPPPTNVTASNYGRNAAGSACNVENTLRGMSLDGDYTQFWRERDYSRMANRIKAAVYHVHGTLDQNVKMDHFTSMWTALGRAHVPRKALIGPWVHGEPVVDYWHLRALRWFEHWLRGIDTGVMGEPAVTTISQDRFQRVAPSPAGRSRSVLYASAGALAPRAAKGTASYTDVPGFPRALLMNADGVRLLYDSVPVSKRTRIEGTPTVDLYARIDTTDTNFVAHLYDLAPDGSFVDISRGYLDARHRGGLAHATDVTPGRMQRYHIELLSHDYIVQAGHRLRLLIASSDSCHWQVAAGEPPLFCESSGVVSDPTAATVTVLEGPGATRITLPIGTTERGVRLRPAP